MMGKLTSRSIALLSTMVMVLALSAPAALAQEPVPFEEAEFNAFATGSTIQSFLLETDGTRAFQADAGFTGAAVDSEDLDGERRRALDNMVVVPADAAGEKSYARSSALEGGLEVEDGDPQEGQYVYAPELVEASAPPAERNEAGPTIPAGPLLYGEALHAEAEAAWADDACVPFFSQGRATAANVELIDTAGDEDDGAEDESLEEPLVTAEALESYSGTGLGPQLDADGERTAGTGGAAIYGDVSHEVVEVEFVSGHTITLSSWLRATASGIDGGAHVQYDATVGVTDPEDGEILDLFPGDTIDIPLGDEDVGFVAQVTVNDDASVETSDDGTYAYGEWTPVSIRILTDGEGTTVAGLDIGFMEAEAEGPEGGIFCEVPMEKTVEPQTVTAGDDFTFTIEIDNPYDHCAITARVVDEISVEEGDPSWTVTGTDPEADEVSDTRIVWEDVTIEAGGTAEFAVHVTADDDSSEGVLRNDAWLEDALCEGMPLHGDADVVAGMPVVGDAVVIGPGIGEAPDALPAIDDEPAGPRALPATGGGNAAALIGLLLAAGALVLRGTRRSQVIGKN